MTDQMDRTPPHNLEAEASVLGAILINNESLDEAAQIVMPPDFYRDAHQRIFRHMLAMSERKEGIDFVTLKNSLARTNELDEVGGPAYISALTDGLPHATNVIYYARIVRERSTLRDIIAVSTKALAEAYNGEKDASVVLDGVQQDVFAIAAQTVQKGFVPMPDLTRELFDVLDKLQQNKNSVTGIASGLSDLDLMTSGWQNGDLITVAARPSMGKSALALGAGFYAATKGQRNVGVFSLEMSNRSLGLRMLSAEAQVDSHRIRTGFIRDAEWGRITQALIDIGEARLHLDDSSTLTVHEMRSKARRLKATVGLDLLIVDYVQLIEPGRRSENRNLEVAAFTRALKGIAKDLDIPVIVLSQLSRALESRADKRPMLSDLRDSGAIEQDSDVVLFIYRDEVYNTDLSNDQRGIAELIIGKQRNGPTGTVKVAFRGDITTFANLSHGAAA
jgi:replicative DNA helicase